MEEWKISSRICTQQLYDVPVELIHRIQSLLLVEEAARTCVLSKAWLHAWSTIPNLRFRQYEEHLSNKQKKKYISLICRTLGRYHRDNIPITSFDLELSIQDKKSDSLTNKCVRKVASKSCLKDLYLKLIFVKVTTFTLTDEIFSGENLNRISVSSVNVYDEITSSILVTGSNHAINCVNLRLLKLRKVCISEELLHNLLSTCSLLEKINLSYLKGSKMTIKVENLPYLRKLKISVVGDDNVLEIYDLPSLHRLFYQYLSCMNIRKPLVFNTDSLGNLRELSLKYVTIDDSLVDIIKSKFPFLESLTLDVAYCSLSTVHITCVSLKSLIIDLLSDKQIDIQIDAPKLQNFNYEGRVVPGLLFRSGSPDKIWLTFNLMRHIDQLLFLKLREVLNLPSKFNIKINFFCSYCCGVSFNIDDVRRVPVPATNVENLTFMIYSDKGVRVNPLVFDALFSIFHPNSVIATQLGCSFKKLIARVIMELKTRKEYWADLKDVEIQNHIDGEWETLTSSWISSPGGLACLDLYSVKFKLTWCPL